CPSSNCSTPSSFFNAWYRTYGNENRSRNFGRHRYGGPAFHQVFAGPSVVRSDVARRERPLGGQEVQRSGEVASGRHGASLGRGSGGAGLEAQRVGAQADVLRNGRLGRD